MMAHLSRSAISMNGSNGTDMTRSPSRPATTAICAFRPIVGPNFWLTRLTPRRGTKPDRSNAARLTANDNIQARVDELVAKAGWPSIGCQSVSRPSYRAPDRPPKGSGSRTYVGDNNLCDDGEDIEKKVPASGPETTVGRPTSPSHTRRHLRLVGAAAVSTCGGISLMAKSRSPKTNGRSRR